MNKLRLHTARFFALVVAIQVLNMGLFVQDFDMLLSPSVISDENVINSMVEFVSEVVLDHFNAIPEYKTNDSNNDLQVLKDFSFKLIQEKTMETGVATSIDVHRNYNSYPGWYHYQICKEINPPPPKTC